MGTGQKRETMNRQICNSGPCSYRWGTGTPGSIHRRYMGCRGPCEISLKDQQEDKEDPSQGWTNLRSGCRGLEERNAGMVGSSLAGGLQDRQVGDGESSGWCRLTVGTLRADLRMTGV